MKKFITFLCMMLVAPALWAQETKDSVSQSKPVAASVAAALLGDSLALVNDSLTTELYKLRVLYTSIKEKIVKHDFDPIRMSAIIDSLYSKKDSSFVRMNSSSVFLKDSIVVLNKEINNLKARIKGLTSEDSQMSRMISDLKMLKELLDSDILTQSEFDIRKYKVLEKYK